MNQSDCVIVDIEQGVECPLCCNNISAKDMANSCGRNISDHNVCKNCIADLKKSGFQKGCIYCGDRSEGNIIVVSSNAATTATRPINNRTNHLVIIPQNRGFCILSLSTDDCCGVFCAAFLAIAALFTIYLIGLVLFQIGQLIDHKLKNEDHIHGMEFSLRNCVFGYLSLLIIVYILFQTGLLIQVTTEKCFIPCYKKISFLYSRICCHQRV